MVFLERLKFWSYPVKKDFYRTIQELVESRGFLFSSFKVTTEDGFILTLHRIQSPKVNNNQVNPVLFMHGFCANSAHWLINSEEDAINRNEISNSLPFALAKEGFDVWLGNFRGSYYSQEHLVLSSTEAKFWDFSVDEHVEQDLPTMINFVLKEANHQSLHYIGHSMGSSAMFGLLASRSEQFKKKVRSFFAFAPVYHIANAKLRLQRFGSIGVSIMKQFNLHSTSKEARFLLTSFIGRPLTYAFCKAMDFNYGISMAPQYDYSDLLGHASRPLTDFGWKVVEHLMQLQSSKFSKYNYGSEKLNLANYGTIKPPVYDLSRFEHENIHLIRGPNDRCTNLVDFNNLIGYLQIKPHVYHVPDLNFGHASFLFAKSGNESVNRHVMDVFNKQSC